MTIDYRAGSVDEQAFLLAKTLPDGRVWNSKYDQTRVLGRLVRALSEEIHRLFLRIEEFVNIELDPDRTRQLILEWERSVGIPDQCFDRSPTVQERRRRIIQKLNNFNDIITAEDVENLLADFGEAIQVVPGNAVNAERLGFGVPPYSASELRQIRHTVAIRVESDAETFPLAFPIEFGTPASGLLRCLTERVIPAHVSLQFFFNENLDLPFESIVIPFVGVSGSGSLGGMAGSGTALAINTLASANGSGDLGDVEGLGTSAVALNFTNIPNLLYRFPANDPLSITETAGDVSQWDSVGPIAESLSQGLGTAQPTISAANGNDSILFDGVDDVLVDDGNVTPFGAGGVTVAAVITPTSVAAGEGNAVRLRAGFDANVRISKDGTTLRVDLDVGGDSTQMTIPAVLAVGETRWVIARFRNSGDGDCDILDDQGNSDTATANVALVASDDINIGGNRNNTVVFPGHVHDVIIYDGFISDADRTILAGLLDAEWTTS